VLQGPWADATANEETHGGAEIIEVLKKKTDEGGKERKVRATGCAGGGRPGRMKQTIGNLPPRRWVSEGAKKESVERFLIFLVGVTTQCTKKRGKPSTKGSKQREVDKPD